MADVKHLIIDRSRWHRGLTGCDSKLLRKQDGKMCCLGFLGMACGAAASETTGKAGDIGIMRQAYPSRARQSFWPDWLWQRHGLSYIVDFLAETNDKPDISEAERERRITETMGKHGITVEFVDGVVPQ